MEMENLMLQRFKVIADYPNSKFEIGTILTPIRKETNYYKDVESGEMAFHPEKFPNIFQPLAWWMDRKVEELPEYIKNIGGNRFYKLLDASQNGRRFHDENEMELRTFQSWADNYLPCTPQDYHTFIENKKVK